MDRAEIEYFVSDSVRSAVTERQNELLDSVKSCSIIGLIHSRKNSVKSSLQFQKFKSQDYVRRHSDRIN